MAKTAVPMPSGLSSSNHPAAGFKKIQASRASTKLWNEQQIASHAGSHGNVSGKTTNGSKKHRGVK